MVEVTGELVALPPHPRWPLIMEAKIPECRKWQHTSFRGRAHGHVMGALALLAGTAAGDLPVHCLRHEVTGRWTFRVGPAHAKPQACGHHTPGTVADVARNDTIEAVAEVLSLELESPDLARVLRAAFRRLDEATHAAERARRATGAESF